MKYFSIFAIFLIFFVVFSSADEKPKEDICRQPARVGRCRASIPVWYYDPEAGECKQFKYGGCDGNDNRYETKEKCEAACSGVKAS